MRFDTYKAFRNWVVDIAQVNPERPINHGGGWTECAVGEYCSSEGSEVYGTSELLGELMNVPCEGIETTGSEQPADNVGQALGCGMRATKLWPTYGKLAAWLPEAPELESA